VNALHVPVLVVLLGVTLFLPGLGGPLGAAALWIACLAMLARALPSGLLSPASLYLLLLGLFHLGLVAPLATGLVHLVDPPAWLSSRRVPTAIGLFSTAAAAFTLGVRSQGTARGAAAAALAPQRELFRVGAAVAALGATLLWIGVVQLGIMSAGYSTYFERALSRDVRLFGFGLMLFPIGLLVAAVGATPRQMWALGAMVTAVLGPLFLVGFRGPTILQVAALLAVWARKDRAVARKLSLAVVVAAIVLVPAVRVTRDVGGSVADGLSSADPVSALLETGGSIYPLVVTAERIEDAGEEPWLGRSYAMAAERIVPNVATRYSAPGQRMLTPSAWVTMHADTWLYDHGGGIGFSGVAEPYLNFGLAGVVVFFLLLGVAMQRWDGWLARDPFRGAIGAASFGFVLWTVRNDGMELFRAVALAAGTVLAAWALQRRPRERRAGAVAPGAVAPRA
jgi:hypothetical protein